MVVEQELQKIFHNLLNNVPSFIVIGGSEIQVRIVDQGARILLTTPVYCGGNYVPTSVRNSIKKIPPFSSTVIPTDLILDEDKFEITLRYAGSTDRLDTDRLRIILEEYAWIADEWRLLLDEQDRNDRVHIPVK